MNHGEEKLTPAQRAALENLAHWPKHYSIGPTPLIAAMRCRVAMKLGDEVDVPDELLKG